MTTFPVDSDSSRPERVEPDQVTLDRVFRHYNISSVDELEHRIATGLRDRGWECYQPTEEFRAALTTAFEDAYLQTSDKIVISEALNAAVIDASYWIQQQDLTAGAQLESVVCPRLTRAVAMILPAYASRGLDTTGSLQFGNFGDNTPPA